MVLLKLGRGSSGRGSFLVALALNEQGGRGLDLRSFELGDLLARGQHLVHLRVELVLVTAASLHLFKEVLLRVALSKSLDLLDVVGL